MKHYKKLLLAAIGCITLSDVQAMDGTDNVVFRSIESGLHHIDVWKIPDDYNQILSSVEEKFDATLDQEGRFKLIIEPILVPKNGTAMQYNLGRGDDIPWRHALSVAIYTRNVKLVDKFLSAIQTDEEILKTGVEGYRQVYMPPHVALDSTERFFDSHHYEDSDRINNEVGGSLEDRLTIIDLLGKKGFDFNYGNKSDHVLLTGTGTGRSENMNAVVARALLWGADPSVLTASDTVYLEKSKVFGLFVDYYDAASAEDRGDFKLHANAAAEMEEERARRNLLKQKLEDDEDAADVV